MDEESSKIRCDNESNGECSLIKSPPFAALYIRMELLRPQREISTSHQ